MRDVVPILLLTASIAGCMRPPHQTLIAPSPGAADAERTAAFERLVARADEQTLHVAHGRVQSVTTDYLVLGDGTRVYHAEDLIPVVPADSPTARHAASAKDHVDRARPWWIATGVAFAATLVVGFSSPMFFDDVSDKIRFAAIGGGVGLAATLAFGYKAISEAGDGGDRISAFTTYNDDLRKRLDVCVDETRVIACSAATGLPPAPAQPAPAAH